MDYVNDIEYGDACGVDVGSAGGTESVVVVEVEGSDGGLGGVCRVWHFYGYRRSQRMEDGLAGGTYQGDLFATSLQEDEAGSLGSTSVSWSSVTARYTYGLLRPRIATEHSRMISSSMNSRPEPLTISPVALSLILDVFSQAVQTLWQSTRLPPLIPHG